MANRDRERFSPEQKKESLCNLFLSLFDDAGLRRFLSYLPEYGTQLEAILPGRTASLVQLANAASPYLLDKRVVEQPWFWQRLLDEFSGRRTDVVAVMSLFFDVPDEASRMAERSDPEVDAGVTSVRARAASVSPGSEHQHRGESSGSREWSGGNTYDSGRQQQSSPRRDRWEESPPSVQGPSRNPVIVVQDALLLCFQTEDQIRSFVFDLGGRSLTNSLPGRGGDSFEGFAFATSQLFQRHGIGETACRLLLERFPSNMAPYLEQFRRR